MTNDRTSCAPQPSENRPRTGKAILHGLPGRACACGCAVFAPHAYPGMPWPNRMLPWALQLYGLQLGQELLAVLAQPRQIDRTHSRCGDPVLYRPAGRPRRAARRSPPPTLRIGRAPPSSMTRDRMSQFGATLRAAVGAAPRDVSSLPLFGPPYCVLFRRLPRFCDVRAIPLSSASPRRPEGGNSHSVESRGHPQWAT